ncbi:uncharacterized protein CBL_13682 [Carabus blaptoides fortunei]
MSQIKIQITNDQSRHLLNMTIEQHYHVTASKPIEAKLYLVEMPYTMDYSNYTPEFWIKNNSLCSQMLTNETFWNSIVSLNASPLHDFEDNCLVRFQGMVQDMHNPEYYFEDYVVKNQITGEIKVKCGKYRDTTDVSENEVVQVNCDKSKTMERHSLVVISFPGLNEWVYKIEKDKVRTIITSETKNETDKKSSKRPIDENDTMETETTSSETATSNNKKSCITKKDTLNNVVSPEYILNFPLPDRNGKCCLVKVYENGDTVKLNDMIDIVGFLSVDPRLIDLSSADGELDTDMESQTHNPPPSLVPRIHCVAFKKINQYNPLLPEISVQDTMSDLRHGLLTVLTQLLFGDRLAADYLICHLISRVYMRKDVMAIGKFSLNLSGVPSQAYANYCEQLYEFLELLVPKSHYLPMTLDNLNDLTFTPKKDYDCNRLTSGILQLSNNTHLVLDETKMHPGTLNSAGVQNLSTLASLIRNQKVVYDFKYYPMEFDCDIPVLTVSEAVSLLPSDVHVPVLLDMNCVQTWPHIIDASKHYLQPELLNKFRVYLTKARHARYNLADDVMELVQNEFVKQRQDNNMTVDDLHQYLVLARLLCLAGGKENLDATCWRKACNMEKIRKARIPVARLPS